VIQRMSAIMPVRTAVRELPLALRLLIVAQTASVFLTDTRFLPVKHNVGAFEVVAALISISTLIYFVTKNIPVRFHRVMLPLFLLVIAALLSSYKLMTAVPERQAFSLLSIVILMVSSVVLLVWYNLLLVRERNLDLFLRALTYAAAVAAVWVLMDSIASGGNISAAGPFKSRSHAGIYMHTAFWLVLVRANWPRGSRWERVVTYPILAILLYTISASGRRSVFFALAVGLLVLALGMFVSSAKAGRRVAMFVITSVGVLAGVYFIVSDFWEPAAFFKTRVGMVDERLNAFTATSVEDTDIDFVVLQRQGGVRAFKENPILGIGYGGFWESEYSEGHEMHSTPMRFVAELGIIGVLLYAWFTIEAIAAAYRAWRANMRGPYEAVSLILLVALVSLTVSYGYNRQMTDRTFWLLLPFAIAFETWSLRRRQGSRVPGPVKWRQPARVARTSARPIP